jgi:hypothetical protein
VSHAASFRGGRFQCRKRGIRKIRGTDHEAAPSLASNQRRDCRVSYHSLCGSSRAQHNQTSARCVGLSEQPCVRRSRFDDGSDIRGAIIECRRDLAFNCGQRFVSEQVTMLRITGGQLRKQDVDAIELGHDVTHNQVGAQITGQVVSLPQCLVSSFAEISTYQYRSVDCHDRASVRVRERPCPRGPLPHCHDVLKLLRGKDQATADTRSGVLHRRGR